MIPGSKLITIVRSIPSLYESSFGYFINEVSEYKAAKTIESFYSDPEKWYPSKWYNPSRRASYSQFAHNHLAFDLGYSTEITEDAEIERIANEIVSTYDLILIRFVNSCVAFWQLSAKRLLFAAIVMYDHHINQLSLRKPPETSRRNFCCNKYFRR